MNQSSPVPMPVHLATDHPETGQLTIFWNDGLECVYALANLRKVCPCANCRDLRRQLEEGDALSLMTGDSINPSTEVVEINIVGRYAIQFAWKDGHDTGIYTYELLRELCPESP